jgi:hypothetical protein
MEIPPKIPIAEVNNLVDDMTHLQPTLPWQLAFSIPPLLFTNCQDSTHNFPLLTNTRIYIKRHVRRARLHTSRRGNFMAK